MVLSYRNSQMSPSKQESSRISIISDNDAPRPAASVISSAIDCPHSRYSSLLMLHLTFRFLTSIRCRPISAPHFEFDNGTPRRIIRSLTVPLDGISGIKKGFDCRKIVVVVVEQTL